MSAESEAPLVSVVVPVYNGASTIVDCVRALLGQSMARDAFEIIVVDDGSTDETAALASGFPIRLLRRENGGAAAARNSGTNAARGAWIAFIDADCVPSRGWLHALVGAVAAPGATMLGAAGRTLGLRSTTAPARFCDLTGGLDAERHLAHPRYPFPPSGNVLYRRDALLAVGGFDPRFRSYEGCDLHARLRARDDGSFVFAPRAVVLHRHRRTWSAYWRQQFSYGIGYAQFMRSRAGELPWTLVSEAKAWGALAALGAAAALPGRGDRALVRRGTFVKALAQRSGFSLTYWRRGALDAER